ncbi:hypothetical protein Stsp01_12810 [Streptomyces sp. NBRC 13847]|nr:hypothetical protein Stsp01_12810 [Streptomyces sp. NBRC 13847]
MGSGRKGQLVPARSAATLKRGAATCQHAGNDQQRADAQPGERQQEQQPKGVEVQDLGVPLAQEPEDQGEHEQHCGPYRDALARSRSGFAGVGPVASGHQGEGDARQEEEDLAGARAEETVDPAHRLRRGLARGGRAEPAGQHEVCPDHAQDRHRAEDIDA